MAAPLAGALVGRGEAAAPVPCARPRFNPDWWHAPGLDNLRGPTSERHRDFARRQCLTRCPLHARARCLELGWQFQAQLGVTRVHGLWGGVSFPASAAQVAAARRQLARDAEAAARAEGRWAA